MGRPKMPQPGDLVTDKTEGEPESFVYRVSRPHASYIVAVSPRGVKPSFATLTKYNRDDFLWIYQWNEDRHLAGTWEPRPRDE